MSSQSYLLLDFGNARKLERFGPVILDRPCPAAEGFCRAAPALWPNTTVTLPDQATDLPALPDPWRVSFQLAEENAAVMLHFQLKITPFGHVGVFPEQLTQWRWLYDNATRQNVLGEDNATNSPSRPKAINLFAYTGGSTMALALGGAQVTHVDASAPSVAWARSNAQLNQLSEHPIRWIVEDARKFVKREIRRGSNYDIVVLDPPSYGHGPSGKAWDLAVEWKELLSGCLVLLEKSPQARLLWTGHSESAAPEEIIECISRNRSWQTDTGRSTLIDINGRVLDAGYFVRARSGANNCL